jgi:cytochrome-b5 reductase
MYQIMKHIANDPADVTEVDLLFANLSVNDILLKSELDQLAERHPQINVHYVLDSAPDGWDGEVGYVTQDMIRKHCPAPADDALLLLCGPRPMTKVVGQMMTDIGYSKDQQHIF